MKLLHTSDWHLGRALYGRKRTDEHAKFLDWLAEIIKEAQIDLLCIAGDVFDSTTPSNKAQQLYYGFLQKIIALGCSNVIITAGNHDSPTLLEAPKELLKAINIHVIGNKQENIEDEIILIRDQDEAPKLLVCAVPYLRDRDIRTATAGETIEDKAHNLVQGIEHHYQQVINLALEQRSTLDKTIPIVAMGHLFTAGGKTVEGDGVRDLYVGSLVHIHGDIFPSEIDYLALGHLHSGQKVSGSETRRYCGSPLAMSFGEANKEKQVVLVTLSSRVEEVKPLSVPNFQKLVSLAGDLPCLLENIEQLKETSQSIWLEIIYQGDEIAGNLQEELRLATQDSQLEILRIVNNRILDNIFRQDNITETLENLTVDEVFSRCLAQNDISGSQRDELTARFQDTVLTLQENDTNVE